MTLKEKRRLRREFFAKLGPNAETFKAMFDEAPNLAIYMKDAEGRIMALNRRNCDICNIRDEWDAIGLTSADLFPAKIAADYMALDHEVLATGKPVIGRLSPYPADNSLSHLLSNVYPLRDSDGRVIGTARAYVLVSNREASVSRFSRMKEIADYINRHFAEGIDLSSLAARAGMSKSSFIHTFTETFDTTPGRYLITIRLNAARKLLETTDRLLSDIALATGFFDQSHFTRTFRKERGITPGQYRRQHRKSAGDYRQISTRFLQ